MGDLGVQEEQGLIRGGLKDRAVAHQRRLKRPSCGMRSGGRGYSLLSEPKTIGLREGGAGRIHGGPLLLPSLPPGVVEKPSPRAQLLCEGQRQGCKTTLSPPFTPTAFNSIFLCAAFFLTCPQLVHFCAINISLDAVLDFFLYLQGTCLF